MVFGYRSAEAEGIKKCVSGNSLVVQWLRFRAFTIVAWIQSLVRELRSYMPCREPEKKKKVFLRDSRPFCPHFPKDILPVRVWEKLKRPCNLQMY